MYYTCGHICTYMQIPHTHRNTEAGVHIQALTNTFEFLFPPRNGFKFLLLGLPVYTQAQSTVSGDTKSPFKVQAEPTVRKFCEDHCDSYLLTD